MKVYISSDIEGTCGICAWSETEAGHPDYPYFKTQMSKESAAAVRGALAAGAKEILVKDAHDSARNIDPSYFPESDKVRLFRGWSRDILCMMSGLDASYDAVVFTGYHSYASNGGNPLSHTMTTSVDYVKINSEYASEFTLNSYIAGYYGVPVVFLSGDRALCDGANKTCPFIHTVAVNEGIGGGVISIHPALAVRRIEEEVRKALTEGTENKRIKMPEEFVTEIRYKNHQDAFKYSQYMGAKLLDTKTIVYKSKDYWDTLRFYHFCL